MDLFYRRYGDGEPLLILHGLFGAGGNWHTLSSRRFGAQHATYVVDLRNHGASPHADRFDYESMADDVAGFVAGHGLGRVHVLGHSMGGKVAMFLALRAPEIVDRLVVVDMSPVASNGGHETIIAALKSVDMGRVKTRTDADAYLATAGVASPAVRQFLLKNLTRTPAGRFDWKMNLESISNNYHNVLAEVPNEQFGGSALFVGGSESDYLGESDWPAISARFPAARLVEIAGAGHWVHADKPRELADEVLGFLGERAIATN